MQGNKKLAMAVHSPCPWKRNEAGGLTKGGCTVTPVTVSQARGSKSTYVSGIMSYVPTHK